MAGDGGRGVLEAFLGAGGAGEVVGSSAGVGEAGGARRGRGGGDEDFAGGWADAGGVGRGRRRGEEAEGECVDLVVRVVDGGLYGRWLF